MRRDVVVARAFALILVLGAIASGCSSTASAPSGPSPAQAPQPGAVAFVDIDRLVSAHPMHTEVDALQDQINALNSQALVAPKPVTAQQQQAQAQLEQDLQNAEMAFQAELGRKRAYYEQKEALAVQQIEAGAGSTGGGPASVLSGMRQQYGTQIQQMQSAAGKTMLDYRSTLVGQDQQHLRSFQQQLGAGVSARVRAKEQQISDAETAYQVSLAQADQAERLNLKAQLDNLALTGSQRSAAQSQLQDLETREEYLINQMKQKDDTQLRAFEKQQQDAAAAQFNAERTATENATRDKLVSREKDLGTQMQQQVQTMGGQFQQQVAAANQALQSNPKLRAQVENIHAQVQNAYVADASRSLDTYQATRKALVDKYSAIAHMQFQDDQAIQAQIDQLSAQRRDLYAQIVSQIQNVVTDIAHKEGYALVLDSVRASNGAVDLTDTVARSIASLPSATPSPAAAASGG